MRKKSLADQVLVITWTSLRLRRWLVSAAAVEVAAAPAVRWLAGTR